MSHSDLKVQKVCEACDSAHVTNDAIATWSVEEQN